MKSNKIDLSNKLKKNSLNGKDLELAVESLHKNSSEPEVTENEKEKTVRISVDVPVSMHDRLKMHLIKNKKFSKLGPFLAYLAEKELSNEKS